MPKPYQVRDHYFRRAKEEGFRARSSYKLQEIQQKFRLIKAGDSVLDLGAAPGSWLQVLSTLVRPQGKVIGLDLQEIVALPYPNVKTAVCDIFDLEKVGEILKKFPSPSPNHSRKTSAKKAFVALNNHHPQNISRTKHVQPENLFAHAPKHLFDCITADLAPATSGIKDLDHARSIELNEAVLKIAENFLKKGGNIISKIFDGPDFAPFYSNFKRYFQTAKCYKPASSRDRSRERFIIGINFQK